MAGLLNGSAVAPSDPTPTGGSTEGQITPDYIESKLHLNPQQKQQLQRIVVAGMKIMFSPQSHKLLLQQMNGPDPMSQKIGKGVAGLLGILNQESKGSLPKNLIIPAGMVLCAHAADFMRKAGKPVSDQDLSQAIEVMTRYVMHAYGIDADKVAAIGASGKLPAAAPAAPAASAAPTAAAPATPAAQPAAPGGM